MTNPADSSKQDMPCQRVVELLDDHLEGTLSPDERAALEAHLAGCGACESYLAQLRAAIEVSSRLRAADLPEPVMDALIHAYRRRS
jgi:RNA polymerase sigma-70 factor (ECF subfamily)